MKAAPDIGALNAAFAREGRVFFAQSRLGGPVVELASPSGTATVALQGAQVLSWRPGTLDVLWLSPHARLGTGKAVRGGIPICWPWFGPHPSDPRLPAHGFVRAAEWQVTGSSSNEDMASVALAIDAGPPPSAPWPAPARLELRVTLAHDLHLELTTSNLGDAPIVVTEALHTYFAVHEVEAARIEGLERTTYIDSLDRQIRKVQDGAIRIDREVDRIYIGTTGTVLLTDPLLGRRVGIAKQGSASTVVWNPWSEKSERLGDVGPDGFRRFVCIETANAGPDAVTVPAGGSHTIALRLSVLPAT